MPAHVLHGCLLALAPQQSGAPARPATRLEEVVANVQAQPLGSGTVGDLAIPEDLLRRLADRILRRSYEDQFRVVVALPARAPPPRRSAPQTPERAPRGTFQSILDGLALLALAVLAVLGIFAWKARSRRKE
jgi:hypothetical protein